MNLTEIAEIKFHLPKRIGRKFIFNIKFEIKPPYLYFVNSPEIKELIELITLMIKKSNKVVTVSSVIITSHYFYLTVTAYNSGVLEEIIPFLKGCFAGLNRRYLS